MQHTSSEKLAEALKLLDEAATQKKEELQSVMTDKYTHLKNAIAETEGSVVRSLSEAGRHAVEAAVHARDTGIEKARGLARDVDKQVHHNPWPVLACTAGVGLLLGYVLGRHRR